MHGRTFETGFIRSTLIKIQPNKTRSQNWKYISQRHRSHVHKQHAQKI